MKIVVGIITFNPNLNWLTNNINSLLRSEPSIRILVVDNGSSNISDIKSIFDLYPQIELVQNKHNKGIAFALNQLCKQSIYYNADWIITMDQDSIISDNYIREYKKFSDKSNIGIVSCRIEDVNFGRMYSTKESGWEYIKYCITSGCMTNLKTWQEIGGFDEELFIDGVDFDYCLKLRDKGLKIIRTYDVCLKHEVGHGRRIHLFGHNALILNHSPIRLYYIARNYLYLGQKYHQAAKWRMELLKRIFLVMFFEKEVTRKIRFILRGISDYRQQIKGKYPYPLE